MSAGVVRADVGRVVLPPPAFGGRARLRVGFTVRPETARGSGHVWANGMAQNVIYLAMLLMRLPMVEPFAVVAGAPAPGAALSGLAGIPVLGEAEAVSGLDLLIEIDIRLSAEAMTRFRARGGKLVSYMAGNAMIMNFESVANRNDYGEVPSAVGFDAAWLTPQHVHTNWSYAALTRTPNVCQVPHIWHPCCLLESLGQFGSAAFFWHDRAPAAPWRIGVFDPSCNVVKTFHLPLLVCEEAARIDSALIGRVLLFSARRFIGNPHFSELIGALDLGRAGKVFAEDRHPLPAVLGPHVDAVVTHQWENNLNYLYWDVLYSGRPLVHNAATIADAGYYYADFDPQDGGRVLVDALARHGSERGEARRAELDVLWGFSIDNPAVQAAYGELIAELVERRA